MRDLLLSAILSVLMLAATSAIAAPAKTKGHPPPGHPTVGEAQQKMGIRNQANLPYQGRVIESIDSNNYTYVHLSQNGRFRWLAVPRTPLKKGDLIGFGDGAPMTNFYSKVHKRTFPQILFTGKVKVIGK